MRVRCAILVLAFASAVPALAQPPAAAPAPRFNWQPGAVHTYRVVQQTLVKETVLEEKTEKAVTTETRTNLTLVRKWAVKDVDKQGVATLEMSIAEMKQEFRRADGMTTAVDSTKPDDAKAMEAYLNKPIVTVRVDAQGKLIEVKEAKGGSAGRVQAELPFRVTLPDAMPAAGATWDRPFALKLDPPAGTGESYDFAQKYLSKGLKDGYLIVGIETSLKATPKTPGEQVPLVPMLWTGDVYFNTVAGKYQASRLAAKAELANHQGEGSKFVYESTYAEDCLDK